MHERNVDSELARKAFEELRPRLDEQTELRRITLDVEKTAALIAAIGRKVKDPEIRSWFAKLPRFDMRYLDDLEFSGLATWHAVIEHTSAQVGATRYKVPANLIDDAVELRRRMLMVSEYHLGHDERIAAELESIKQGKGYSDLAMDLMRVGRVYEANESELVGDKRYYRASDRRDAAALAHRIQEYLGEGPGSDAEHWNEYVHRAWTYMMICYEEVSVIGRWLFRDHGGEDMFPSLHRLLRLPPSSRASQGSDEPDEPATEPDTAE